jgi:2,3-bisphosphoglycerate-independent phosphoglycerate mutase
MERKKFVGLVILDGWGIRFCKAGNAVAQANTPNYDRWLEEYESSILDASGEAVGLVAGQMGNSEVGHLNIGSGRVVYQSISKINRAIESGDLISSELLESEFEHCKQKDKNFHLVGLLGPGGVHSHVDHMLALIEICGENGIVPVLHLITDGRDTPPRSGKNYYQEIENVVLSGRAKVGSVGGRFYYMDRDNRWDRTAKAYETMTGDGKFTDLSVSEILAKSYANDVTDEFVIPLALDRNAIVRGGDHILFFNFRADRMRQIVRLFAGLDTPEYPQKKSLEGISVISMTQYAKDLPTKILFSPEVVTNTLSQVLSENGMKQFHIAETEKYAHVTYFFNGGNEKLFEGEERLMIPSPKVSTYDLQPEMSAREVARAVLDRINTANDDFILVNFANPDMVGHTGDISAAKKAVDCVDQCAGEVVEAIIKKGGVAIVTADHGNSEQMVDLFTGEPHTYHTTNPVNFIVISDQYFQLQPRGKLADISPTILNMLNISTPKEMTGKNLVKNY